METIDSQGCGLAIEFTWQNDRYGHEILAIEGDRRIGLLSSIEGSPTDSWPVSPPMQQLSLENINGQSAVLGVGMAGNSHWSISFLVGVDPLPCLLCEMACFAKGQPERIGSQYKPQNEISTSDKNVISLTQFTKSDRHAAFQIGDSAAAANLIATCDQIVVSTECRDSFPATIQWKYKISLTDLKTD